MNLTLQSIKLKIRIPCTFSSLAVPPLPLSFCSLCFLPQTTFLCLVLGCSSFLLLASASLCSPIPASLPTVWICCSIPIREHLEKHLISAYCWEEVAAFLPSQLGDLELPEITCMQACTHIWDTEQVKFFYLSLRVLINNKTIYRQGLNYILKIIHMLELPRKETFRSRKLRMTCKDAEMDENKKESPKSILKVIYIQYNLTNLDPIIRILKQSYYTFSEFVKWRCKQHCKRNDECGLGTSPWVK